MSTQKFDNVIIFGPTGDVGSYAALEASTRGAKVWLAMRNPDKTIETISAGQEEKGNFVRIQADLTDPASITNAVTKSGAKAAYIYLVWGADLKATLQAMKGAGIEYIVFLSSFSILFSIEPDVYLRSITPDELIPFAHAQVEIAIEEVGIPFTALRPAYFASNALKLYLDRAHTPPKARVLYGDVKFDNIDPENIGQVAGAVLVEKPSTAAKEVIYLCGPELISQDDMWAMIKKITGKDIDVEHVSPEQYVQAMTANGIPPPLVNYTAVNLKKMKEHNMLLDADLTQAVANVKKYSGREATKFADYVAAHKDDVEGAVGAA